MVLLIQIPSFYAYIVSNYSEEDQNGNKTFKIF
jgi:hypothetical protein